MASLLKQIGIRLLFIPLTLIIITATLYGVIMMSSADERAQLYLPLNLPRNMTAERLQVVIDGIIEEKGLNDPFPQQYYRWISDLLNGDWGYSPTFNEDVLVLLKRRLPVTAELTFYSVLLLVPLALFSGVVAGWRAYTPVDRGFRVVAFISTSIPPFILGLFLLSVFYVGLGWFPRKEPASTRYVFNQHLSHDHRVSDHRRSVERPT